MMSQAHHQNPQQLMRLAQALIQQGNVNNAVVAYHQCMNQFPDFVPAYLHLSHYFLKQEQIGSAMQVLSKALEYSPTSHDACRMLAPLLASFVPHEYHPTLERDLQSCYADTAINHQQLARIAAQLLLQKYDLLPIEKNVDWNALIPQMTQDSLWKRFLVQGINTDARMESRLTEIRRYLLQTYHRKDLPEDSASFVSAFALQLFANEYVLQDSDEEKALVLELQKKISTAMTDGQLITSCLLLALYQPLINIQALPDEKLNQLALQYDWLKRLLKHTCFDIAIERKLAGNIPTFDSTEDEISTKVRQQYEQNPYPRWHAPPTPKATDVAAIIRSLPGVNSQSIPNNSLQVLIAGCGTGYEPIDLARMDKSLHITAIDLSVSSLAYAQRMAQYLNVTSQIEFRQGNILAIQKLDKQFDVVNSTGVLHHMENPIAGWQELCEVTKSGGVMRISLYSKYARARISAAHAFIKESGFTATTEDIKRFRQAIMAMDENSALGELAKSDDFYSISGCRDLVFHAQEHHFTLPQIKNVLPTLGLTLIGFDVPAQSNTLFKQKFGEKADVLNLALWDQFEQENPDTFAGMYQLWCQKN